MIHARNDPRQAGFTLAELLVALGVLALLAGLLVQLLGSAFSVARSASHANQDNGVLAVQRILRYRIERLAPVIRPDSSEAVVEARGDARAFSFVAPPLEQLSPDALRFYRLLLTPAGDLVLYSASSLDDSIDLRDPSLVGWQATRLLGNVRDFELAYFGPDRLTGGERWQAFWIDRPQPPALVRIRLRFADGERRQWPDLIIRPRVNVNTACRIQRSSGRCEAI